MRLPRVQTARLAATAAAVLIFQGLFLSAVVPDLTAPLSLRLPPHSLGLSALLGMSAIIWLMIVRYPTHVWVGRILALFCASPMLMLLGLYAAMEIRPAVVLMGGLAIGMAVLPWLPRTTAPARRDLYDLVLGLIDLITGIMLLVWPDRLAGASMPVRAELVRLAGGLGLVGAAALWWPASRPLTSWRTMLGRRLVGSLMPWLLAFLLGRLGIWAGALAWATLAVASLFPDIQPEQLRPTPERADIGQMPQQFLQRFDRRVEIWTWLLGLLIMGLAAVAPENAMSYLMATAAMVALTAYNLIVHWALAGRGPVERRIFWHMAFLTVMVGVFLQSAGDLGLGFLALLAVLPSLTARFLGLRAGVRVLVISLFMLVVGGCQKYWMNMASWQHALTEHGIALIMVGVAGIVGIRGAEQERRMTSELTDARTELQRQLEKLVFVRMIGDDVRRSLDLHEILQTTVVEVGTALNLCRCFIRLAECDGSFPVTQEYVAPDRKSLGLGYPVTPAAQALFGQPRAIVAVDDIATDPRLEGADMAVMRAALLEAEVRAAVSVPIQRGDALLGLIVCHECARPRHWTKDELEFLAAIGSQVGLAISHASAHQEVAQRHAESHRLNQELVQQNTALAAKRAELEAALAAERQAEEALRESEDRFRSAFVHAQIGMAVLALDGRWLRVNRACCDMLGYEEDELLGVKAMQFMQPEDARRMDRQLHQIAEGQLDSYAVERGYVHKSGRLVRTNVSVSAVRDAVGGPLYLIAQLQDITERKEFEAKLLHLANYDPLTDLFNRRRFQQELEVHLVQAIQRGCSGAVLFLDLDGFKYVNDTLGHHAGDELLKSLAAVLQAHLREPDIAARLGGDEFAVLLPQSDVARAQAMASELLEALRAHKLVIGGKPVMITTSMGIALFPEHGATADEVLAHADVAMYTAKECGRNTVHLYTPDDNWRAQMEAKLTWEHRIREALEHERFVLLFQPICHLQRRRVDRFEALLRMRGEGDELISPAAFLDTAERFGLIHAIDRWVVRQAISLIAQKQREGQRLCLEVNLSGKAFADPELLDMIQRELASTGIDPGNLVLEITETAAVADTSRARQFIDTLKSLGCSFAIDDFGAGFSSFYYLKHLPVDYLKIDGSFIRNLPIDSADQHMVKAMVEVARGLGKQTIAEFVGDDATVQLLREYGVDYAQGYHIGRPAPLDEKWFLQP